MKRFAWIAILGLATTAAHADVTSVAAEWVRAGLNDLRTQNAIYIDLAGTQTLGGTTKNLKTQYLYEKGYDADGKPYEKMECQEFIDNYLTMRVVGDGTNIWTYDPINKTYNVTRYGTYSGKTQPTEYTKNLLQAFMASAKGPTIYIARLMLDAKGNSSDITYSPWLPASVAEVDNVDPTKTIVRYLEGNPLKRTVSYLAHPDGLGGGTISLFGFWETSLLNGKQRTTNWNAYISTGTTFDKAHYQFSPPAGTKPIISVK